MPIRPELRQFYQGAGWEAARARILARAKGRCERCRRPNGRVVELRTKPGRMWWKSVTGKLWRSNEGRLAHLPMDAGRVRRSKTQLGVAHLNHVAGDDRDCNLQALCRWCHLQHDREPHQRSARETRLTRKDQARPMLTELFRDLVWG